MVSKTKRQKINEKIGKGVSKKTLDSVQKLEQAFLLDCTIGEACFYAGISKSTYHNWVNKDKELLDRLQVLRNSPVFLARQTLVEGLKDSPELALKYLERKRKNEFSLRTENENTQKIYNISLTKKDLNQAKNNLIKQLNSNNFDD